MWRGLVTLELIHLRAASRDINSLALPACPEDGQVRPRVRRKPRGRVAGVCSMQPSVCRGGTHWRIQAGQQQHLLRAMG